MSSVSQLSFFEDLCRHAKLDGETEEVLREEVDVRLVQMINIAFRFKNLSNRTYLSVDDVALASYAFRLDAVANERRSREELAGAEPETEEESKAEFMVEGDAGGEPGMAGAADEESEAGGSAEMKSDTDGAARVRQGVSEGSEVWPRSAEPPRVEPGEDEATDAESFTDEIAEDVAVRSADDEALEAEPAMAAAAGVGRGEVEAAHAGSDTGETTEMESETDGDTESEQDMEAAEGGAEDSSEIKTESEESIESEPRMDVDRVAVQMPQRTFTRLTSIPILRRFTVLTMEFYDRLLSHTLYYDRYISLLRQLTTNSLDRLFVPSHAVILRSDPHVAGYLGKLLLYFEHTLLSRDTTQRGRENIVTMIAALSRNPHNASYEHPEPTLMMLLRLLLIKPDRTGHEYSCYTMRVSLVMKRIIRTVTRFKPRCMAPVLTALIISGREEEVVSEMGNLMELIEDALDECLQSRSDTSNVREAQGLVEKCVFNSVRRARSRSACEAHSVYPYFFLGEIFGDKLSAMMRPLIPSSIRYDIRSRERITSSSELTSSTRSDSTDENIQRTQEPSHRPAVMFRPRKVRTVCLAPSKLEQAATSSKRSRTTFDPVKVIPICRIKEQSSERFKSSCDISTTF